MHNSTRQAIQASVAVLITIVIGHLFALERPIWATLTAVMLVSSTFGESIKKAFERVSMTFLGGIVATVLYSYLFGHQVDLVVLALLASVFLVVYFFYLSYAWTSFFITALVVFLFALLRYWDWHFMLIRFYETVIGAITAVVITGVLLPIKTKKVVNNHYVGLAEQVENFLTALPSIVVAENQKRHSEVDHWHQVFSQNLKAMKAGQKFIEFELAFSREARVKMQAYRLSFDLLYHYLFNLLDVLKKEPSGICAACEENIAGFTSVLMYNIRLVNIKMQQKNSLDSEAQNLDKVRKATREKIVALNQAGEIKQLADIEGLYGMLYSMRRINESLMDLIKN